MGRPEQGQSEPVTTLHIIVESGELIIVANAVAIIYKKICPYGDHEFETTNPHQKFCRKSHSVMYCQKGIAHAAN